MKIETHLHTKGGSGCAHVTFSEVIEEYSAKGYGAIIVTNHYNPTCYFNYPGRNHKEKLDFYFSLYEKTYELGRKKGIKVFCGAEVTTDTESGQYQEMMLYGFNRKLFYDNPPLFTINQKELFTLAEKNGCFLYQTHPKRTLKNGTDIELGDYRYMHGAEVFNGNKGAVNNNELAEEFAKEHNLIRLSGSDYHRYHDTITGGIITDNDIDNEGQLIDCLFNREFSLIIDGKEENKR